MGPRFRERGGRSDNERQAADQNRQEQAEIAEKVFELSQSLAKKWVDADCRAKRHLLGIVCLNFLLDGVSLVPEMRKPFVALAEGLPVLLSRGDKTPVELFVRLCAENAAFRT